jgi:hydroxymethylpyrimidine pyrophosphatase-like HAD family hydrolase
VRQPSTARRPRLIVADIDGTILGRDHREVSPRVRAAIGAAVAAGVPVALSTGRPMTSLTLIAEPLGLAGPHVAFDGALVSALGGPPSFRVPLALAAARALVEAARAVELCVELYTADAHFIDRAREESFVHARLIGVWPTIRSLDDLLDSAAEGDVIKGQVLGEGEPGREKIRAIESMNLPLRFGWAKPPPGMGDLDYVNVTDLSVSKGAALVELARAYGLGPADVMAIGDGPNDAPLLREAGVAIAMGNANAALKELADAVVASVDEDGFAEAVERYVL